MAQPPRPVRPPQRVPQPPRRTTPVRRPPQRRSRWGSPSLWLIIGIVAVVGYLIYNQTFGVVNSIEIQEPPKVDGEPVGPLLSQPFNILLIGVDLRQANPEDGARSDTLIVVRIDPLEKTAAMLSIPRDTFVELALPEGEEPQSGKINRAYMWGYSNPQIYAANNDPIYGGATLARQTVERFLGIEIPYFAQVDFQGFQKLIDEIGGITLDVPHAILDAEYPTDDYGYMRLYIPPGLQRMDGITALRYARTRHADNDFGRGQRQQQVVQAALTELKRRPTLQKVEAIPALLSVLGDSVRTNLPITDLRNLRGLAALAQELPTDRITRFVLEPGEAAENLAADCGSDICWKEEYVQRLATQLAHGPSATPSEPETAVIQVQNAKGENGVAGRITLDLQLAKYKTAEATTAPTTEPYTQIWDYTGKPETRSRLAQMFGIKPEYVLDKTAERADAPFGVDIVLLIGQDYEPDTTQVETRTAQ